MQRGMGRVSRRTMIAAVAALTMAGTLASAGSAHALLGLNLNLNLSLKTTTPVATASATAAVTSPPPTVSLTASLTSPLVSSLTGGLNSLTSGQTQLLDTASNLLCNPLTQIGSAIPGGSVLGTAGCALGALDYQWVSRLTTPTGEIVRRQVALVNVPTLLNVDADVLPDLIGTVQVLALDKFTLRVERVLGETSSLPVRLEAIIDDPIGALPRDRINVGYDARDSVAPTSWVTTATLPEDGADDLTTLNITQDVTGAIPSVTTVGGLFDGDSLDRKDPMGGTLKYTPAPPQATLGLTLGRYMEVRAGASTPVGVQGSAEIVNGTREQRGQFQITGLPQQISVRYEEPGANQRTVTYTGTANVPVIDATYTDRTGGTLTSKAIAHLKDIPTGMVVKQTGAKSGTFQATGGPLGSVEVGYANGEPQLLNVDHPYARVVQSGSLNSYAGRIDELVSASVDATDDIAGELQLGPDGRKKFRALVDTPGRHIDALVSDLPRHLKVTYDVDQGLIDYNAFGETIQAITLDADQSTPFFGRVKRIHALIEDLPSLATVRIKPDGGGVKFEANNPIGKAEALLTSGPDASLPAGQFGAQIEDLTSRFTAFARVKGLRLVDVTTGPGDAAKGHVQLASTPLRLRYLKEGQTIDATLSAIPSDVTVSFDPDAGKVEYDANAPITSIDATVTSDTALFGRVKQVVARVEGLPQEVSIGFKPATGSGATFSATPAVGMIQAALTDGSHAAPTLADGKSGVILRELPDEFALFGRIFNVSSASVVTSGDDLDANLVTGPLANNDLQDLELDVTFDTPGDAVTDPAHIVGFVQDLPATLTLSQHGTTTTYDASSVVPKVTLDARNLPGGSSGGSLDGDLHNVVGTLTGVPKKFKIVSSSFTTGIQDTTSAFERVDLEAWDHGPQNAALPEDDRNKIALNLRDGRLHVQARVFDLSKVLLTDILSTKVETAFGATPKPLDIAMDGGTGAEPLDLDVTAGDLPLASTFEFGTLLGMKIKWDVHTEAPGVDGTDVDVNVSSKDVGAVIGVDDLPTDVDVCIGGRLECSPQSKQVVLVDPGILDDSQHVVFFNDFTAATEANGIIKMSGKVCLPPTDGDGEGRTGDVYGTCIAGTAPNRIEIDNLRIKTTRLEMAAGDSDSKDGDGDPIEDDLLKLYLDSDSDGIKVGELKVRNDTSDSTMIIRAGDPPLRNSGDFFFGLFDLTVPPSQEDEPRLNQIECGDLDVEVDLPVLGLTDVLPGLGEFFLGDICI